MKTADFDRYIYQDLVKLDSAAVESSLTKVVNRMLTFIVSLVDVGNV